MDIMDKKIEKIACVSSNTPKAQQGLVQLADRYPLVPLDEADALIALGGDGFLLQTMHEHLDSGRPIYGLR